MYTVRRVIFTMLLGILILVGHGFPQEGEKVKILRKTSPKPQEKENVVPEAEKKKEEPQEEKRKVSLRRMSEKGDAEAETPPLEYGRHSLLIGARSALAFTSSAKENYNGFSLSPDFALRGEYVYRRHYMALFDLGYNQGRYRLIEPDIYNPRQEGIARADYIRSALLFGARYNLGELKFPRFLAEKKALSKFYAYSHLGPYFSYLLSSELEVMPQYSTAGLYDYSPYALPFVWGLQASVGFEMQIVKIMSFFEFSYVRALSKNFRDTRSLVFVTSATAEQNFMLSVGAKYQVMVR
ncbi:MAG: hypothetical protein RML34_04265 [Leptospiraceae bacterium]|nr:hypothetical protein [Leptospiraceae bacterium]